MFSFNLHSDSKFKIHHFSCIGKNKSDFLTVLLPRFSNKKHFSYLSGIIYGSGVWLKGTKLAASLLSSITSGQFKKLASLEQFKILPKNEISYPAAVPNFV